MPIYTFKCDKELNGCGHTFEVVMSISQYKSKQMCPKCRKSKSVIRDYQEDAPRSNVILSDDELKLGHLAQRNTERFSNDKKEELNRKHNAYRESTEGVENLPGEWLGPKGKRKIPTKQRTKDIRKIK